MSNKIKWILGISVVFFLVLATNYIDRNNFRRMQDSIETIYEDRLVAQELVLKLSALSHEKKKASIRRDTLFFKERNAKANEEITAHIEAFKATKMTTDEARIIDDVHTDFNSLRVLEDSLAMDRYDMWDTSSEHYEATLRALNSDIFKLSDIQMEEGRKEVKAGKSALQDIELMTQLEVYILIFLALVVQVIILYSPKKD